MDSVFHWYACLADIFTPSLEIKDIIGHMETLIKFTQAALDDSQLSLT